MQRTVAIVLTLTLISGLVLLPTGCATKKGTGGLIGAGTGAVVGGVIGDKAGNTAVGAILGAAIGGAAGAWIGDYMDEQAAEIDKDLENATVERVGEGIKITFDSGILFDSNEASLQPQARANLDDLAETLQKYPDTDIIIYGHTDSQGSEEWNLTLSRNRASSVAAYLSEQDLDPSRFTQIGMGETQPVADNSTPEGRRLNRRVELAIMANDELKDRAERIAG